MSVEINSRLKKYISHVDVSQTSFQKNYEQQSALVQTLQERLQQWSEQGKDKRIKQHRAKHKFLGRERLQLLLDADSAFLEIMPLAGQGQKKVATGNPLVGGIGLINGVECMIVASAPTVGRGAMNMITGQKWYRFAEISAQNHLPFISLLESAGADLSQAFEVFHAKPGPFYTLAQLSKQKIPTMAIVFGTCIAGGAYMAGMSDFTIMVEGNGQLALAGEKLVLVATGEKATDEELGGAAMHSQVSGSSEYLARNEHEAISKAREIIATFPRVKTQHARFPQSLLPPSATLEPIYNPDEILGILPASDRHAHFECREVIARIVDGSEMFEFKPDYGPTVVTVWAYIYGIPVGIISNNGVIFPSSAQKATHFINLCNQRGYPIIYLHNVTGFMVGKQYERDGMLKWGSQMINAMSNSEVPNITILMGSSFGAANFAMCGRGYAPRFIFAWPTAKCAVMGPDQLAGVMEQLARDSAKRSGAAAADEEKLAMATQFLKSKIETQMESFYCSSYALDDGVIDPRDTRRVLGMCLSATLNRPWDKNFTVGLSRL